MPLGYLEQWLLERFKVESPRILNPAQVANRCGQKGVPAFLLLALFAFVLMLLDAPFFGPTSISYKENEKKEQLSHRLHTRCGATTFLPKSFLITLECTLAQIQQPSGKSSKKGYFCYVLCSVAQLCPNLCNLMYYMPGSSVHGIF